MMRGTEKEMWNFFTKGLMRSSQMPDLFPPGPQLLRPVKEPQWEWSEVRDCALREWLKRRLPEVMDSAVGIVWITPDKPIEEVLNMMFEEYNRVRESWKKYLMLK